MDEFALIRRFFPAREGAGDGVLVGIGDDAAVVTCGDRRLAIATDSFVAGVHFPADANAARVGYRLAMVNLSDFAAIGAVPRWATLALTLPQASTAWLEDFAAGLDAGLATASCVLVGGDTTRGPLTLTLQLVGEVADAWLARGGARPGDYLMVSGSLGDARAGLAQLDGTAATAAADFLEGRYYRPTARLALGQALCGVATAAIDVSDGLLADLEHLAKASGVGLEIDAQALPLSLELRATVAPRVALEYALSGGDDYELAFTVAAADVERVRQLAAACATPVTTIGRVVADEGIALRGADGIEQALARTGFRHF